MMKELTIDEIITTKHIWGEVAISLHFSDGGSFFFRLQEGETAAGAYRRLKNAVDTLATYKRYHDEAE